MRQTIIFFSIIFSLSSYGQNDSTLLSYLKEGMGTFHQIGGWGISPNFTGSFYEWSPNRGYKIIGGQEFKVSDGQIKKGALVGHWSSRYPTGELFEEADYDTVLTKFQRQTKQSQDLYLPEEDSIEYRTRQTHYKRYYKNGSTLQQSTSPKEKVLSDVFYFINGDTAEYRFNDSNTGDQIIKTFNPDKSIKLLSVKKCDKIKCIQVDIDNKKKEKSETTTWFADNQKIETYFYDLSGNLISTTKFSKEKYEQVLFNKDKTKVITISNYITHWTTVSTYNAQGKLTSSKKHKDQ